MPLIKDKNMEEEKSKKVCLSVSGIDEEIVVDKCYGAYRQHFCHAIDTSLLDGLKSDLVYETPRFVKVNFSVKYTKNARERLQLAKAYFKIIKHVCDNCSSNAKNNIGPEVAEMEYKRMLHEFLFEQKIKG